MEKTAKEVFNEIQTTIDRLRAQLDELEERLAAERESMPDADAPQKQAPVAIPLPEVEPAAEEPQVELEPEPVELAEPEPESEDLPAELEPAGEDLPAEPESPEVEARAEVAPAEDAPVEDVPAEPETIDLSIDMAAMGAKPQPDAKNYQWMIDLPGSQVANVISAISLNDRVLFINTLFGEDPALFQQTIAAFNSMESVSEAVSYVMANFPDWNLSSEVVYRLMMAVRRKLK